MNKGLSITYKYINVYYDSIQIDLAQVYVVSKESDFDNMRSVNTLPDNFGLFIYFDLINT
jgi:hypothetical protein